jgi:hypothetical protein
MSKSRHAEFIERTGQLPQTCMHAVIAELSGSGEAALAAELELLRQQWSRAVRRRLSTCPPVSARKRLEDALLRCEAAVFAEHAEQLAIEREGAHAAVAALRTEGDNAS